MSLLVPYNLSSNSAQTKEEDTGVTDVSDSALGSSPVSDSVTPPRPPPGPLLPIVSVWRATESTAKQAQPALPSFPSASAAPKIKEEFDEYGAELGRDARFWRTYVKEADQWDAELVEGWNK
ncbi:hypothetical protein BDV93DRAFT_131735 [Ceratobasidium sp. AG-I]|nr:hypothetical protein BDV93DRAFT_131735 [Ceratobasidium sp. AG-I]